MSHDSQLQPDPRTGLPTAITGDDASPSVRATCAAQNRRRSRGLLESTQETSPWQSLPIDVWTASFERNAGSWDAPTVDIADLGLSHSDEDGLIESAFLTPLPPGAEAQPFWDREHAVVYKLFDLTDHGTVGKKLAFRRGENGDEIAIEDATWIDTMDKVTILNAGGGLPTEIIGLSTSGEFLLAKQPLARPFHDYEEDLKTAEEKMHGIRPTGGPLRQHMIVSHIEGRPWLIGDLHIRNIMRDSADQPVIIDALLGKITPGHLKSLPWLRNACQAAEFYQREGHPPPDPFLASADDEL